MRTITIDADNVSQMEYALEEVLRLLKQGYTSGINPTWDLIGEDEPKE